MGSPGVLADFQDPVYHVAANLRFGGRLGFRGPEKGIVKRGPGAAAGDERWLGLSEQRGQVRFLPADRLFCRAQETTMPRRPRRNHSPAFKAKVALAAVDGSPRTKIFVRQS